MWKREKKENKVRGVEEKEREGWREGGKKRERDERGRKDGSLERKRETSSVAILNDLIILYMLFL